MKLHELKKWTKVELTHGDVWEFEGMDWMYWKWVKYATGLRGNDEIVEGEDGIYKPYV